MNNIPIINTVFIIKSNTSNLIFKVYYFIENTDEYNFSEERYRPVSIIEESNSTPRISTTTKNNSYSIQRIRYDFCNIYILIITIVYYIF